MHSWLYRETSIQSYSICVHILQSAPLPYQVLQHQVLTNHPCNYTGAFERFYSFCITHKHTAKLWCTKKPCNLYNDALRYLVRTLRNCKHLEIIFSLGFILVFATAETCLSVETSSADFSLNTKFSTTVKTPICMHWTCVNVALHNYSIN